MIDDKDYIPDEVEDKFDVKEECMNFSLKSKKE